MTRTTFGIGTTLLAAGLASAFVLAQGASPQGSGGGPPQVGPPPQAGPGQPGRGPGMGPGQGRGRVMMQQGTPQAGRGAGMRGQGPGALAGLKLTDEQRANITDLERAARDQVAPLQNELEFTQKSLHRELFADKRDAAKIAGFTAKIAALQKQIADVRVKTQTAVADLLTAEQRETMRLRDGGGRGMGLGIGRGGPMGGRARGPRR